MAGAAQAQSSNGAAPAGPRYMTWANRPADTTPGDVLAVQTRTRNGMIPRRVAPSQAIQRPMMQPTPQVLPASRGLTPASAWIGPRVAPAYAPGSPDPTAYATSDMMPASPAPTYVPPPPPAPAPAPVVAAPPAPRPMAEVTPAADPARDPMAPRPDAAIFRLQPQGAEPAAPSAETGQAAHRTYAQAAPAPTGQQGARYYSVHRGAGRQPDAAVMPDPVFFDSVTLDLAQPPANEPLTRDAQGRRRPVANDDPSLP